jgi:hypothetical protein
VSGDDARGVLRSRVRSLVVLTTALALGCSSTPEPARREVVCVQPAPSSGDQVPSAQARPSENVPQPALEPASCRFEEPSTAPHRPVVVSVPGRRVGQACDRLATRAQRVLRGRAPSRWREEHAATLEARAEAAREGAEVPEERTAQELVDAVRAPLGRCVSAGTGAWALEPVSESFGEAGYVVSARPVHVDVEGRLRAGPSFELHTDGIEGLDGDLQEARSPDPIHDFDGDGRVEVTLGLVDHLGRQQTRVFTATNDRVEEVRLPLEVGIAFWVDYDHDGRPDLLANRLYTQHECYEDPSEWGMPSLLLHAGPGTSFSADDAVATRYARELCPCAPSELLAPPTDPSDHPLYSSGTLVRLACARLWGSSLDELAERLEREYDALGDGPHLTDVCAETVESLLRYAEPTPPLELTP